MQLKTDTQYMTSF